MIPSYQVMSDTTFVKMRVKDTLNVGSGSVPVVAGEYSFIRFWLRGNDITNPFTSFSNDTPAGRDQWATFYQNAIVHKSGLSITPVTMLATSDEGGLTSNTSLPYQITIVPMDNDTASSAGYPLDEQPYSKTRMFNSYGTAGPITNAVNAQYGNNVKSSVYNSMMTKKILGYKDLADVDEVRCNLAATPPTGVPTNEFYWAVEIKSLIPWDGVTPTPTFTLPEFYVRAAEYFNVQFLNRLPIFDSAITP